MRAHLTFLTLLVLAAPALAVPGPDEKIRIMRDKTMQIHLGYDAERIVKETAAVGFNVLSLPGHKDFAGIRRRADQCARYGLGFLQWFRGTAKFHAERHREDDRYVWPTGHVSRLLSPNSDAFWADMHEYIVEYAKISAKQPAMMGVFLDFEPYDKPSWGMTYPLSYDPTIVAMFAKHAGVDLPDLGPKDRKDWIEQHGHADAFREFQIAHWRQRASALRAAVDEHNPQFVFCVYPALGKSPFLSEVVGQCWGTERAPLWSADPGNYGERSFFTHYDDALRQRFEAVKRLAADIRGKGIHVRYLVGLDPIGRLGDAEYFGKSGNMFCEAADGYWVFYEGPRFENKLTLKVPSGDHRDYYQWFARGNQATIDGEYDFWRRPRETPPTYDRKPQHPQKMQYAGYSRPYSYSVTKLMQERGFEASHLVESWHVDADYLRNFDVVFLKNFNGGPSNDPQKMRNNLREHVRHGGTLLLNYDLRWFGESPFPEIAKLPTDKPSLKGRLVVVTKHDALGGVAPGTKFKPYFPTYTTFEPGPQGNVLLEDEQGRPVFVAGEFGSGRVIFAGHNYPRPSEVRNLFGRVPDDPELENIEVFWHQKQPYPEGVERDILLGIVEWLNAGRRWWDHEYDGSVPPTAATPKWQQSEEPPDGMVVRDEAAASGHVWRQGSVGKWAGFRLVETDGEDVWRRPDKTTIEVRFRLNDHEEPAVLFVNQPLQWQALLEGAGPAHDVLYLAGRNGSRYGIDEQWNIVRLLVDGPSISAYVLFGGELRGRTGAWTKVTASKPLNPHWLGFGPDGPASFHFGGSVDIDYVRWTHDRLIKPVIREKVAPSLAASGSGFHSCEAGAPRPLAWRDEKLVVTGHERDPQFMGILGLINDRKFDEAAQAIEKMDPKRHGRDRAQLAVALEGHPDCRVDTKRLLRMAREGLKHATADPMDVHARRLLHEIDVFEILPYRGMPPIANFLPARDAVAAGDVLGGIGSARSAGRRQKKLALFHIWSLTGMFEGKPQYGDLLEATGEILDEWSEAGAQGSDPRIATFRRLLAQVKSERWACMTVPEQSVLYPRVLRTWMRTYYWWWKQIGERQRPMSKKGFLEVQPKFQAMFPSNEAARIYGGEKIPWGDAFLPDEGTKRMAPAWAVAQQELRGRIDHIIEWWIRTRQREDGLLEGHPEDDCEVLRRWSITSIIAGNPRIEAGIRRLVDGIWNSGDLVNGYDRKMKDVEHSSEMSADTSLIMALEYGDPMQFERFLQTAKLTDELHTAINPHGHRHFKTISMSATKVAPNDVDTNYHGRAMRPAAMVAWYSGHPRAVKLLHEWSRAWSEDTVKSGATKPAGVMPAVVHFDADAVDGKGNWTAREYGDLYMWHANNCDMIVGKMLVAWMLTGDDSVLDGMRAQLGLVRDHLGRIDPNAPHGSLEWAAKEMAAVPHFATWYRQCTHDTQFDEVAATDTQWGGAFLTTGDPAHVVRAHEIDLGTTRYNLPMVTSEVIGMDRVDIRPWSLLAPMTGSAVNVTEPPTFAVTWRDVGVEFAALVRRFDDKSLNAWVYSFDDDVTKPRALLWRLRPGEYELRLSADRDMDGRADGAPLQTVAFTYQRRRDGVSFELPVKQTCLVEIRQTKRLADLPRRMPDIAIASRDMVLPDRAKSGQAVRGSLIVHNIGSVDGRDVQVRITARRKGGDESRDVATERIAFVPWPEDLVAKTRTVDFSWTPAATGDYVLAATLTDGGGVPEIYLGNNETSVAVRVE